MTVINGSTFRFAIIYIIFTYSLANVLAIDCNTIPISLSTVHTCVDKTCSYKELATVSIPNEMGASSCFEFVSPDISYDGFSFSITVVNTHFRYNADYHYSTDCIKVDSNGWCGCAGGHPGVCPNCRHHSKYTDAVSCTHGLHTDDFCIADYIGGHGTYCVETGFKGDDRFKITHYGSSFSQETELLFEHGENSWLDFYDGIAQTTVDTSEVINATILSSTSIPTTNFEFTLFDHTNMGDFYLLPASEVNSLQESNVNKIGWYKTDQTTHIAEDISNLISVKLESCKHNRFHVRLPFTRLEDLLSNRTSFLSSRVAPDSILLDPGYQIPNGEGKSVPFHNSFPFQNQVSEGFFGLYEGEFNFMGVSHDGNLLPWHNPSVIIDWSGGPNTFPTSLLTNRGIIDNPTRGWCEDIRFVQESPFITVLYLCRIDEVLGIPVTNFTYTVCKQKGPPGFAINCLNWSAKIVHWPDLRIQKINFKNAHFNAAYDGTNGTIEEHGLLMPPTNGEINFVIEYRHLNITFESTTIQPELSNIVVIGDKVTLEARSLTTPGTCMIATTPAGLLTAQAIVLSLQKLPYTFFFGFASYTGNATFRIVCHQTKFEKQISVSFNNTIQVQNDEEEGIQSPNDAFNPFNFGNLWGDLFEGNLSKWGLTALIIFTVILIIGILIICGLILSFLGLPFLSPLIMLWKVTLFIPKKLLSLVYSTKQYTKFKKF